MRACRVGAPCGEPPVRRHDDKKRIGPVGQHQDGADDPAPILQLPARLAKDLPPKTIAAAHDVLKALRERLELAEFAE